MMPPQPNGIQVINYMKKLFILAATLITLQAQSTNITVRLTIVEPTVTNVFNINASTNIVNGLNITWQRDIMKAEQETNTPPTFAQSVRLEVIDRLKDLKDIADADEIKRKKVDALAAAIGKRWSDLTVTERQQLEAIANRLGL
jgi:phosphoserine aminotransferase